MVRRLVGPAILIGLVVACLATAFEIYLQYGREVDAIHGRMADIKKAYLPGLAHAARNADTPQVERLLNALVGLPDVEHARIDAEGQSTVEAGKRRSSRPVSYTVPLIEFENHNGIEVGKLLIVSSTETAEARAFELLPQIFGIQLARVGLICLVLLFVFSRFGGAPALAAPAPRTTLPPRTKRKAPPDKAAPLREKIKLLAADNKRLTGEVEQRLDELQVAHDALRAEEHRAGVSQRELREIEQVVARDLAAPMRALSGYGAMIDGGRASIPPDVVEGYRDNVVEAREHLRDRLDHLVEATAVVTSARPMVEVNLTAVVRDALGGLDQHPVDGVELDIDDLPKIEGDAVQLRGLFERLFDNAFVFARAGVEQQVRVVGRTVAYDRIDDEDLAPADTYVQIEVHDNGVGFENGAADRFFGLFERGDDERAGDGAGLAICRRVVDRHGGRIEGHSPTEVGATFTVTLPVRRRST